MKPELLVEYRGEVLTLRQVSKKCNVHFSTVRYKATVGNKLEGHEIHFHKPPTDMKEEAKKIERPLEKDYFEYRGNQILVDYGHAINFIDAQDDYIDQLTSERDEQLEVIAKDIKIIEKLYQEVKALKKERDELKEENKELLDTRKITDNLRKQLIKDGLLDESNMTTVEQELQTLKDLLKEIDAWLSFNNNPTRDQLKTLRKSIQNQIKP